MNSIHVWHPGVVLKLRTREEEQAEIDRCKTYLDTYKIQVILANGNEVFLCGMTRKGYFILSGKPYVWPWREVYIPNFIYKHKNGVEVWSAPMSRPWDMYQGRLKLSLHLNTLCIEGQYGKGKMSLCDFMEMNGLGTLDKYLENEDFFVEFGEHFNGNWKSKTKSLEGHPCLPHLSSIRDKEAFLAIMVYQFYGSTKPITDTNDINNKRIIGVDWLVGHLSQVMDSKNVLHYMMKRIHTQGQLVNLSSYFETISHVTRTIRGRPVYGNHDRRQLHPSHMGVYCPYRSSEGETIGLKVDLVPDLYIHNYTKDIHGFAGGAGTGGPIVNGYLPRQWSGAFEELEMDPSKWKWTDGGRVVPGRPDSIGYVAQQLVFPRHMPPVRSMYATTHLRQAVKVAYPQKPVVYSRQTNVSIVNGCNAIVAISGYHGWNIEDAIVVNKSFVERGGLQSICNKTVIVKRNSGETWDALPPKVGTRLTPTSKCVSKITRDNKDRSQRGHSGIVTQSYRVKNDMVTVVNIQEIHSLEIGDKISTRSGQKGVIGHIALPEDMPYSVTEGIVPDIIINPAHLPSRMTVSQMLESFFGKEALIHGRTTSASDGAGTSVTADSGKEGFVCGRSGKKLGHPLFVGTVFYMALHHMVHKKCRSRNSGPVVKLTSQPTKGGGLRGGLRVGEMECDSLRSRGAHLVLKDRLRDNCDLMEVTVCKSCGWLEPQISCCSPCSPDSSKADWVKVKMSRTTRLVLMEMYSLGIFPKLHVV